MYLQNTVPRMSRRQRFLLSLAIPVVMRWLCDAILVPHKQMRDDMGIPDEVFHELWWDSPSSRKLLRDLFADVRALVDDLGLMNPTSVRLWKALGIHGRPSRFRS